MPRQKTDVPPDVQGLDTAKQHPEKLRTSRQAIYTLSGRGQLPGLTRIGHSVRFERADLLALVRVVDSSKEHDSVVGGAIGRERS